MRRDAPNSSAGHSRIPEPRIADPAALSPKRSGRLSCGKASPSVLREWMVGLQASPARLLTWGRLLMVLFPLLLYASSLGNDFLIDDELIVTANTRLAAGQSPLEIFRRPERFMDFTLPYFRPLTNVSYWVDAHLWGSDPLGFHVTNWLLHAVATLLVLELARALTGDLFLALIAALLFAAHPIHTESVMMVQGRTDLLATVLILLSLLAMLHCLLAADRGRALVAGGLSIAAWLGAVLAKEVAVTWPALAVALCLARPTPGAERRARPILLLSAGIAALTCYFWFRQAIVGKVLPVDLSTLDTPRIGLVPITFAIYARFFAWPFSFSFIRSIPTPETWADPRILTSGLLAIGILLGLALLARRDRILAVGAVWTLATLLPVLNVFPIPGFVVAERYLYLPSVGFCMLVAAGIRRVWLARPTPVLHGSLAAAITVLLVAFTTAIQVRAVQWQDPVGLFESMARRTPNSFFVQNNLGLEYLKVDQPQQAVDALQRARDLEPANPAAWNNLGVALRRTGRLAEARRALERAVALDADYAQAYGNLAEVLLALGDRRAAETARRRAQTLSPGR